MIGDNNMSVKYRKGDDIVEFTKLVGKRIVDIRTKADSGGDIEEIIFDCVDKDGDAIMYIMNHHQDCCEYVAIKEMDNDLDNIRGLVLSAEEITNEPEWHKGDEYYYTLWTFYKIQTETDSITISWFGGTSSCYAIGVDIHEKLLHVDGDISDWALPGLFRCLDLSGTPFQGDICLSGQRWRQ
jgi:hypothetical protein